LRAHVFAFAAFRFLEIEAGAWVDAIRIRDGITRRKMDGRPICHSGRKFIWNTNGTDVFAFLAAVALLRIHIERILSNRGFEVTHKAFKVFDLTVRKEMDQGMFRNLLDLQE